MKKRILAVLLSVTMLLGEGNMVYAGNAPEESSTGVEETSPERAEEKRLSSMESAVGNTRAGDSLATATSISIGSTYNGIISDTNTVDYYKFNIAVSGRVSLKATAGISRIFYRLYDASGNELWWDYPYCNSTTGLISTDTWFDLTAGTYYFVFERCDGYTGNYSFKFNFESAQESFGETGNGTNNSIYDANTISVNTNYKGQIADNDEKDFYKFTLSSSGRITLKATAGMSRIFYRLYDASGNELWWDYSYCNSTTGLISTDTWFDLTAGTYYFVFERYDGYTGNYSFNLGYQSAGESFGESQSIDDNSIYTARTVSLNTTYKGQIADNDDKDFYRFTLSGNEKITVNATAGIERIYYHIYDVAGNQIWERDSWWNSTSRKSVIAEELYLSKGTYYFVAERAGSCTGNYSFKLQKHVHSYKTVVTRASLYSNGEIAKKCSCGAVKNATTIYYPKTIKLSKTKFTYNGKAQKPSVIVKDSKGRTISKSNYKVTYKNCKDAGIATVVVTFKGNYQGSKKLTYSIEPKSTTLTKVTAKSKAFTAKWKKQSSQITGYQIQYATNSKFKSAKIQTVASGKQTSAWVKKLKGGKKYYVRVRTYKKAKVNGSTKNVYSEWSKARTVKTKK